MFNRKLKLKIKELEAKNKSLSLKLTNTTSRATQLLDENSLLKKELRAAKFELTNKSKYEQGQKVEHLTILEKTIVDIPTIKPAILAGISFVFLGLMLFDMCKRKTLAPISKDELSPIFWSYKIFDEKTNSEMWITEKDLTRLLENKSE